MNVIVSIDGQEAVPIRALPYVTGWTMSPDVVAKTFAHADHWTTKLMNMQAFHLSSDGSYTAMLPKEWDGVMAELTSLSNMLQMDEKFEGGGTTQHGGVNLFQFCRLLVLYGKMNSRKHSKPLTRKIKKFWDDSYSVRKCVYDNRGTISLLSPLNDSEWSK